MCEKPGLHGKDAKWTQRVDGHLGRKAPLGEGSDEAGLALSSWTARIAWGKGGWLSSFPHFPVGPYKHLPSWPPKEKPRAQEGKSLLRGGTQISPARTWVYVGIIGIHGVVLHEGVKAALSVPKGPPVASRWQSAI